MHTENALEINPDALEVYSDLGDSLAETRRYSDAIEAYRNALKVKSADSELHYSMASVYSILKKHDVAIDSLKRAFELNEELKYDAKSNNAFESLKTRPEFKALLS